MKRVFIIAEAGVNHNGSVELAKRLIDVAVKAGADAVKFQTFKAEQVISHKAKKAEYQTKTTGQAESQLEMVRKLQLSEKNFRDLSDYCQKVGIEFMSTPFDHGSVDFLVDHIGVKRIKIPSGEVTNAPYLLKVARKRKPVIISTGMSDLEETKTALGVLAFGYLHPEAQPTLQDFKMAYESPEGKKALRENVIVLHCTSEYPAPFNEVNLKVMDTMQKELGVPVGYSDHTQGIAVSVAAVARGAAVIEKHFTLDREMQGPDHKASMSPDELIKMVEMVRQVEQALGDSEKKPTKAEEKNKVVIRRSLVASRSIRQGEKLTEDNIMAKRPGSGLSPFLYWDKLGTKASRDYDLDDEIL